MPTTGATGSFKSWGRAIASAVGIGDPSTPTSELRPLLGHVPTRPPQRKITSEGTRIVIWPATPTTFTNACTFATDLPSSLDDALPAPLYRSHVAELNALLRSAHLRRRTLYISQTLSTALLALLLLIISIWVAVAYHQYVVTVVCVVGILVLGATQPLVAQGWFAGLKEAVDEEVEDLVGEWNARAPAHARFEVEGAENLAVHPRWGVETEGPTEPELHVIILDLPLRRQAAEQAASNEVLLTPEGDGMMMAVKVIRSIH